MAGVGQGLAQGDGRERDQGAGSDRQFWAAVQAHSGRIRGDGGRGTAGSDSQLRGLMAGMDLLHRESARAGVLAGFLDESLTMDRRLGTVRGNSVHVGGYGQWDMGSMTLRGVVGFSQAHHDAERRVSSGSTIYTARGSFETSDTVMSLEARFSRMGSDRLRLQPVGPAAAAAGYVRRPLHDAPGGIRRDGSRQRGPEAAGL